MTLLVWLGVAAGGGVGAVLRVILDAVVSAHIGRELPAGTLAVNVSGTLALGLVAGATLTGDALLLIGTAVIGSYTTFSTWLLETHRLAEEGERAAAIANILISIAVGICAIALGRMLA